MYIPKYYKETNPEAIRSFISQNSFAALVSEVDGRPWATHTPLILTTSSEGKEVLLGHIAWANKQWRAFQAGKEVLAIFSGPNAYISSSWYDHMNVPTWNYVAVHIYGAVRIIEGNELKAYMSHLMDKYEAREAHPLRFTDLPAYYTEQEMKGLVAFEIAITDIQAVSKLSQNRDEANKHRIIDQLEKRNESGSSEIARRIKDGMK